ncbi:hypothetical protein AN191_16395 [Loktanella sp. 5RATIMAR09]|uniref:hypothetical protein n=1 Tax=Loktanella sp. 5RATIMAR09 TaxID=1225655 RepID=UPI0006EB6469|nr:hypothetical protein [Loktanella sp. 5RATIMAR09]KQI70758.1 hypothetical protein AN191_16395 [Loktanella sp. 5RATIMAR09]
MSTEFEKHTITDFGQKLAHAEGILGAYLPSHVFESDIQQKTIDCNKFSFSRLRSGKRRAANWELARFVELFDLGHYGFDYRLFLLPFEQFSQELQRAGVGSYGASAAQHLRETLRGKVDTRAKISIHRDRLLSVGGIGNIDEDVGLVSVTSRDKVTLRVPLQTSSDQADYVLLLHDFPASRALSCLMPSLFAPDHKVVGQSLRLPQSSSGYLSFPVGGRPGYRCFYGIQSTIDLAGHLGFQDTDSTVPQMNGGQVALLLDILTNLSMQESTKIHVSFGEYLLK